MAAEATRPWGALQVGSDGQDVTLAGPEGNAAKLTHYAFGQLAVRAGAPAGFLRSLPAPLAADVLADRMQARHNGNGAQDGREGASLLFHQNGGLVVRALTTTNYVRVWNHEVIARLIDLSARHGLVPAKPTFRADWAEDRNEPSLYASDHDMFAFLMTPERAILDPVGQGLYRGVIVQNSEVGDCSLKISGFWFRDICGNRIIWGAKELCEVRLTHVGQIRQRWAHASVTVRRYLDESTGPDQARFQQITVPIAGTKDEVLDQVFGKRLPGLTRSALDASFDAVVGSVDGDPLSQWGLAQGITRHSQSLPYADERQVLDRAAGKLLQVAF